MAQQGFPPRSSSREPDSGHDSYDRAPGYDRASGPARPRRADRQVRQSRPDRHARQSRPDRAGWQQFDAFEPDADDDDLPPWAGPAIYQARPASTARRPAAGRPHGDGYDDDFQGGPAGYQAGEGHPGSPGRSGEMASPAGGRLRPGRRRGRAAAARLRKSRRRVYRWCGTAIVACVVAAGITAVLTHHARQPALYVTSLQSGEFKSVPSACSSVSRAVLNQYLPPAGRTSTSELASSTNGECSFTVDAKPVFMVLEVAAQSYQPFAAASGDGSATANAQDNFALVRQGLSQPQKKSPLPPAQISTLARLGQQAYMAFQREHVSGIVTDVVTVVIRERNTLITVSLSGQESGHGFGPVPVTTLEAGAQAAAKDVLAKVLTQPTA